MEKIFKGRSPDNAQLPLVDGAFGIALNLDRLSVFHGDQKPAAASAKITHASNHLSITHFEGTSISSLKINVTPHPGANYRHLRRSLLYFKFMVN
jgi:hypothetical protein